jgi:hypothetical protein
MCHLGLVIIKIYLKKNSVQGRLMRGLEDTAMHKALKNTTQRLNNFEK